jgi:type II secretory pathway component GspD/PulD (secretin)
MPQRVRRMADRVNWFWYRTLTLNMFRFSPGLRLLAVLILLSALAPVPARAQSSVLEVIPLKYRTVEQVIPVLKPLLDKGGTLSGMQSQLIIRTTPANLAEIKQVLATLDAMPRRLMITVRQDADINRDRTTAEVSGRVSSGSASVIIPGSGTSGGVVEARRGDDVVRGRIENTRAVDNDRNTQTLQVLEGNSAFIRIGLSVPLPQRQVIRTIVNGQVVERVISTAEYRDVTTGFYALPRLAGDRVMLEISPQRDTLPGPEQNLPRGSISVQSAATTVSGRLGEWMEIGGAVQSMATQQSVNLGNVTGSSGDNRRILLKVDEIR